MLKIVSFNINGIRARPHQLAALKERHDPDIIGIQEVKVADEDFPLGMVEGLGYVTHFFGQKSHYGVALLSKQAPVEVTKGLPGDGEDAQRRAIIGRYPLPSCVAVQLWSAPGRQKNWYRTVRVRRHPRPLQLLRRSRSLRY